MALRKISSGVSGFFVSLAIIASTGSNQLPAIGQSTLIAARQERKLPICLSEGLIACPVRVQEKGTQYYLTKYGYVDKSDKMVIEPRFDRARPFYEGLAAVRIDGLWGYIDHTGKFAIPAKFLPSHGIDDADDFDPMDFSEGLVAATTDTGVGFIDKTGKFAIAPRFSGGGRFSDGFAAVSVGNTMDNTKFGYIDKTGRFIIQPKFGRARPFSEGLAAVSVNNFFTGKWGFINKAGEFVIKPQYEFAFSFGQGLALVLNTGKKGYHGQYIDQTGKPVLTDRNYHGGSRFCEGMAAAQLNDNYDASVGYIDKTGKVVIPARFVQAEEFHEGAAVVRFPGESSSWGLIDRTGKVLFKRTGDM